MGLAEYNGYTSFIMLNLYPKRDTYPDDLPDEADKKIQEGWYFSAGICQDQRQ